MDREWRDQVRRIAAEHDVPVYDSLAEGYLAKFGYEDFLDPDHLCHTGAVKFPRDVAEWMKQVGPTTAPVDR